MLATSLADVDSTTSTLLRTVLVAGGLVLLVGAGASWLLISRGLRPVDRLIEYVTQFMTLEPGDVLATGTPAGVGAFRKPPVWLKPGDRVRIEIERIGALEHGIG